VSDQRGRVTRRRWAESGQSDCPENEKGVPLERTELALPAIAATAAAATAAPTTATAAIVAAAAAAPVATAATAATTAAVATATAPAATLLALLGFVHTERTSVEGRAVHALHGLGRFVRGAHGYEREAARTAGLAIRHEMDVANRAELREGSADAVSGCVEREISNVQTSVHRLLKLAQ
jgi:hypothetical protein